MNKHLINLCYFPGAPLSRDPSGKVVVREAGAISFEIDGTFHRSQDLLNKNTASDIALPGSHTVPKGAAHIYIGKTAVDSLLAAYFKESGKVDVNEDPIKMKVEELDNFAEGFSTAFDENMMVEISAQLDKVKATSFDNDFDNIAIKAEITINFSNPIDGRFLAAQAKVTMKGTAKVSIINHFLFSLQITQEQVKVQKFTPYFLSETTLAEFEEEYLDTLQDKILTALNKKFKTGIPLPLGADLNLEPIPMIVSIYKDYLLVETRP